MRNRETAEPGHGLSARGRCLLCVGIALALAVLYACSHSIWRQESVKEMVRVLSDSFLLPGALLLGIGALSWIGSKGQFDILSYGCSSLFGRFLPFDSVYRRHEKFYDYRVKKNERGRPVRKEYLLVGGVSFALALLCSGIYGLL